MKLLELAIECSSDAISSASSSSTVGASVEELAAVEDCSDEEDPLHVTSESSLESVEETTRMVFIHSVTTELALLTVSLPLATLPAGATVVVKLPTRNTSLSELLLLLLLELLLLVVLFLPALAFSISSSTGSSMLLLASFEFITVNPLDADFRNQLIGPNSEERAVENPPKDNAPVDLHSDFSSRDCTDDEDVMPFLVGVGRLLESQLCIDSMLILTLEL